MTRVGLRARARPKLTDDVLGRIFQRRADGWTWDAACAEEGVSTEAVRRLAQRDPDVREAYDRAQALGAEWYAGQIKAALEGEPERIKAWTGWAWLAERFHPTVFRKPAERVESTTVVLTPEERRQKYAEYRRGGIIVAGADAELEAECVAAGLLPADVVDGEIEGDG